MNARQTDPLVMEAIALAELWQARANRLLTRDEKAHQAQMERLLGHPRDKVVLAELLDQSFRTSDLSRVADQIVFLLGTHGIPEFFPWTDRWLARLFVATKGRPSAWTVPKMIRKMREDSSPAIIPGEPDRLAAYLEKRRREGARTNINYLGEAVLGESEAARRLAQYVEALRSPDIETISVKISTLYSQILPVAFDHTVSVLKERLSVLYRVARDHAFIRQDGSRAPKLVNLDMEAYHDLEITLAAFMQSLDQEDLLNHTAGVVLQAYLPDSCAIQRRLTDWARRRVERGGSPIRVRIVKGANMEMELVEAALNNWPLAPYDNKRDVDANYKRLVDFGMQPESIRAVHLGIASHNLFELAYAQKVAERNGATGLYTFEMLEGMADHVRRAIQETTGQVLVYAPVAGPKEFINGIAYLIRRLDENTSEENFLRYIPRLRAGSKAWAFLKNQFIVSFEHRDTVRDSPHRIQNRQRESFDAPTGTYWDGEFVNEPDTDWSLAANRQWADEIRRKWRKSPSDAPIEIPVVIGGDAIFADRDTRPCMDPSQFREQVCVARFAMANEQDLDRAVAVAKADADGWRARTPAERHAVLSRVAVELRRARGDLIGAAAANTGKSFTEADVEVSEAVDFAEYYPFSVKSFAGLPQVKARGKGVAVVISPWNFPIAIPCGGITAALAAGNTVLLKPSSDAVLVAWRLCKCFWDAGISQNVLQFVPCSGADSGARLTDHPDVDVMILTGGTETGLRLLRQRPSGNLSAETGGKNATIVTALSDRDQAIKNVIVSAFGNGGQKCSATSLLILEREVYRDPDFRKQLVDAAESLQVGSAWDFKNRLGPLIRPPSGALKRGLSELEPGESWALEPRCVDDNPHLWSPGIKWNVKAGSYTHMTELFGPVLAVMEARNLDEAIRLANQTGYGLTSGLESLDPREQKVWKESVKAGNLYVNRSTTGAITLRQPFGGMGRSVLGAAMKAGGPDYVFQFMDFEEEGPPEAGPVEHDHPLLRLALEWELKLRWGGFREEGPEILKAVRAIKSYRVRFEEVFARPKDHFHLRGQDNHLRYVPVGTVVVRVHERDTLFDAVARIAAALIAGCELRVSIATGLENGVVRFLLGHQGKRLLCGSELIFQTDADLIGIIPAVSRIRYAAPDRVPTVVFEAAAETGFYIARSPVLMDGRIELLHYLRQQSICNTYHRYGNLGERAVLDAQRNAKFSKRPLTRISP